MLTLVVPQERCRARLNNCPDPACLLPALLLQLPRKLLHHKSQRSYDHDSHHRISSDAFSLARTACSVRLHVQSNCCCTIESSCFDDFASVIHFLDSRNQTC